MNGNWQPEVEIATLNAIYPQQIKAFPLIWLSLIRRVEAESSLYDSANHSVYQISEESPAENILIVGHGANSLLAFVHL